MKTYRQNELKVLAIFYLLLIIVTSTNVLNCLDIYNYQFLLSFIKYIATSVIIPLAVFIFDCLLTTKVKNILLISKLYGYKVFGKIRDGKVKDERFNVKDAQEKYKEIIANVPKDNKPHDYENQQWFKIYKIYEDKGAVEQSQKDFLMLRDMYSQTILFFPIYFVFTVVLKFITFSWTFIIILAMMAIIFNIVTHNKAKRFVLTVIAKDL